MHIKKGQIIETKMKIGEVKKKSEMMKSSFGKRQR